MRNPPCQSADCLHLLGVTELFFKLIVPRKISAYTTNTYGVTMSITQERCAEFVRDLPPVFGN